MLSTLSVLTCIFLVNENTTHTDILESKQHVRFRRLAVTTGTTKFLIVGLDRPRHIGVQYKSDIGFVNPHTESDGGYHDNPGFSHKNVLICVTLFLIHTGVIRECTESPTFKKLRYCLGFLSRKAIDNATGSIVWGQEVQ